MIEWGGKSCFPLGKHQVHDCKCLCRLEKYFHICCSLISSIKCLARALKRSHLHISASTFSSVVKLKIRSNDKTTNLCRSLMFLVFVLHCIFAVKLLSSSLTRIFNGSAAIFFILSIVTCALLFQSLPLLLRYDNCMVAILTASFEVEAKKRQTQKKRKVFFRFIVCSGLDTKTLISRVVIMRPTCYRFCNILLFFISFLVFPCVMRVEHAEN